MKTRWFPLLFIASVSAQDYETPDPIPLAMAAPATLISGTTAKIADPVSNDGMMNTYSVTSSEGEFTVTSTHGLCKLIREVHAIEEMAKLEGTAAFSDSAIESAKGLGTGAKNLVTKPTEIFGGAAKGIGKAFRRLGDRIVQGDESSATEDNNFESIIGFSKTKREYAYKFGVDVYSDNETLQEYLDQVAWTGYSGSFAFNVVAVAATGGVAGAAISVTNYTTALEEMIRDLSPSDLRKQTRESLEQQGIGEDLVNLFIRNDQLSPRHQAFIAGALATMVDVAGKENLVRRAADASSHAVAFDRQIQTQMFARIHATTPLERFIPMGDQVVAVAKDGSVVAAAVIDYLIWSRDLDLTLREVNLAADRLRLGTQRQLWLMGHVTERASEELSAAGWTVHADLIDDYLGNQCNPDVADLTLG